MEKIDALEANEPECTCEQVDADVYDNRHCGVCNEQSAWNREFLALQAELRDVMDMFRYQASGEGAWSEEDAA
jgi:hypothetical protein